jgi:5-methylcytosine-specific restriction endonuclease McrA
MVDLTCVRCSGVFEASRRGAKRCPACRVLDARERARRQYQQRKGEPEFEEIRRAASRRYLAKLRADPKAHAKRLASLADWRLRNAEHASEYDRRYRKANAAHVAEKNRRRRARLLDAWVEDVDIAVVFERDGGRCGVCGNPIDLAFDWPDRMSLTLDHVVPLARGGEHSYRNVQVAHAVCNSRKNDRTTDGAAAR